MSRLLITGVGAITAAGVGCAALRGPLSGEPFGFTEEELPDGSVGSIGRLGRIKDAASRAMYNRWGQLDAYSRYGFVAARVALQQAGFEPKCCESVGIILGTAYGCMDENQRFDRFSTEGGQLKGASPLVFKGTVDNAPAGWVAVVWGLKGPTTTFVSGDGAALEALWFAEGALRRGRAPAIVAGGVERFVAMHQLLRVRDEEWQGDTLSEGAGVVLAEREDSAVARGATPLAELVGVWRSSAPLGEGLGEALRRYGIDPDEVGLLSMAWPEAPEGFAGLAGVPAERIVTDKQHLGEFHGAWGGVALAAALERRNIGGWQGRPCAVVQAHGEGRENLFAVVKEIS